MPTSVEVCRTACCPVLLASGNSISTLLSAAAGYRTPAPDPCYNAILPVVQKLQGERGSRKACHKDWRRQRFKGR